jgi:hypothetical protein
MRVFNDVKFAVHAGADVIVVDGMQGGGRRGAAELVKGVVFHSEKFNIGITITDCTQMIHAL